MQFNLSFLLWVCLGLVHADCNKKPAVSGNNPPPPPVTTVSDVDFWLTKSDQTSLLQKQSDILSFGTVSNSNAFIDVDTATVFQTIDGFGYTLTGGSAYVIDQMGAANKSSLLKELFGKDSASLGVSYLRLSIGSSDLNASVFSYDDMPAGQTDTGLNQFSINPDRADLIPLLKQILLINPDIKILATPWSAPVWMKDNGSSVGGSLQTAYYHVYAQYFVKYIQQMKTEGINIDAIAPQNEPLNPNNNPSLYMTADQEGTFIKGSLGPAFQAGGINTKIILYDHNCDRPDYPLTILADTAASHYVNGSAFHLYAGDISALSQVHTAYPDKQVYFTEQYTASTGDFGGDLRWHVKNVLIGSTRNWSRTALEWNLANDASYGPHTPGGCTTCKGALTIGGTVSRNVAYYIIGHASKFVPAGSVRIASNIAGNLQNVAFTTPAGRKVLIVENDGTSDTSFNIRFNGKWVSTTLPAGSVGTYIWK
ncbi:MAG TPA: glycoside hydrolase family 30 beta sandwich domain-containing protein [Puia sp.]|nr:glycoside hydrolase family 30 beta sandwich domain-containing protein [Puia sp.]